MKIYVVSEIDANDYDDYDCNSCWKVVRAFARKDDAEKYVKAQKFPNDFDIEEIEFVEGF